VSHGRSSKLLCCDVEGEAGSRGVMGGVLMGVAGISVISGMLVGTVGMGVWLGPKGLNFCWIKLQRVCCQGHLLIFEEHQLVGWVSLGG